MKVYVGQDICFRPFIRKINGLDRVGGGYNLGVFFFLGKKILPVTRVDRVIIVFAGFDVAFIKKSIEIWTIAIWKMNFLSFVNWLLLRALFLQ